MSVPPVTEAPQQRVVRAVRSLLNELGSPRPVLPGSSLERDLGLGSLERVELLSRLEREFEVRFPDSVLAEAERVADLVAAVQEAAGLPAAAEPGAGVSVEPAAAAPVDAAENLPEVLLLWASAEPDRPQVIYRREDGSERAVTYRDLLARSAAVAADLAYLGVGAGDRVALMLPTGEEFFYSFLGILFAQAVPVPMYPPFRADRLEEYAVRQAAILQNSEAALLITAGRGEALGKLLRPLAPGLRGVVAAERLGARGAGRPAAPKGASAPALIQYTSGSTGDPKGVLLTHGNLLANIRAAGRALGLGSGDVGVSWLPLYHDMGLIGAWLMPLYWGFPVVILSPLAFLSRPERWLWAIHYHRATLTVGPNFGYELCARKISDEDLEGLDLSSLRAALNGSEPVRIETIERFTKRFAAYGFRPEAMLPVYGLAECTVALTAPPVGRAVRVDRVRRDRLEESGIAEPAGGGIPFVSVGRPLEGHEVRIVSEDGKAAPERVQGRIWFRGPSAMQGYFRRPEATAAISFDGWLDTGDLGYRADGELYVTGRRKDVILKAGRNIHPQDIEAAAAEVEGVRKGCVAAFGAADPGHGTERLVVAVETRERDPAARERIRVAIGQRLVEVVGLPADDIVFLEPGALPKTSSGKLRRAECRLAYEQGRLRTRRPAAALQWVRLALRWAPPAAARVLAGAGRLGYAAWFWTCMAACVIPCWLLLPVTGRRSSELLRWALRRFTRLAGVDLAVEGIEHLPRGPAVVVANHGSYLDTVFLIAALPATVRFVAKKELLRTPLVGSFMRRIGHLPVERSEAGRSAADAERLAAALASGLTLVLFPEGTFTRARGLRPFRLGAFQAAARARCPIVPAAITGARYLLPDRTLLPKRGRVRILVRPPIYPAGEDWREVIRLRDAAFQEVLAWCGEPRIEVTSAEIPA